MREKLTKEKLLLFLDRLGNAAKSSGRCYLTGGASAVLFQWRNTTIDIDLKFDPEPLGVFESIPTLKEELKVNVELVSPELFIPEVSGWRERSIFIVRFGNIDFYHYDFVSQALAKLERAHAQDIDDVKDMLSAKLVTADSLREALQTILPGLARFPAIDRSEFVRQVKHFLEQNNV